MINFMLKTVAFIFLLIMFLIVITGGLWVLRVMVYWWLDIDYVQKIKEEWREHASKRKNH